MAGTQPTITLAGTRTAVGPEHFSPATGDQDHAVQFYDGEEFLCEAVARFLGAGLLAGDRLIVFATPMHRQTFAGGLLEKGFDVERARAAGRLIMVDARETLESFMSGGAPDWERFRARVGGLVQCSDTAVALRVRAYGEMVDLLWRDGNPQAAIRLEEYWNDLGRLHPFSLLCAYVMGNFYKEAHAEEFQRVCATHTQVAPAEGYSHGAGEDQRLREISRLQQRAQALETELKHRNQLEEALRAARSEAEASIQAKDEFLAMLGHELRNPLSPILTALELMKLRGDGDASREYQVIDRQTRHLVRLVDDLLDVSRITRGKVELRKQPVDLRDVLAKAIEIASPLLEQRRHHYQVTAPPRGMRLLADEARISQVIANLLTNAAKYTDPGGHISVAARHEGGQVVIEVTDDGMGIPADLLPRVFDLFVQGRQPTDRAIGGLGIGLALVRNLVQMHDGEVQAHSRGPGAGSTFTVRLPALDHTEEKTVSVLPPPAPQRLMNGKSKRILVVDDNEDALEMMKEMLWSAGHEVRGATSGPSALEVVKDFQPDIAILDIGLPAMDGYELAARLRAALGAQTPLLMALTGYGQESDRARSRAAGFSLHLVKPLEASVLLQFVEAPGRL
jgi:signal transduction histidine kinase/CheY-like chemotaxis protein